MKILCAYQELRPISKLKDHPKNPNKHDEAQIERLAKLYEYHGIRHPIIISKLSGFIVAGHGRKAAALKAGMTEFPVEYQEFESEDAEYAFLVADNAISSWAELDLSAINFELPSLGPEFDIENLGLRNFAIDVGEKFEMEDELREDMNKKFILEITLPNAEELADIRDDLTARGYIVKEK